MIDYLAGIVHAVYEKSITLVGNQIGFLIYTPKAEEYRLHDPVSLVVHFHWNPDNGPLLYGFKTIVERDLFRLIIDCPKIGPSIALGILSHLSVDQFCEIVMRQDAVGLSSVHGVGLKKAEAMIVHVKDKVALLIEKYPDCRRSHGHDSIIGQVKDVLASLNYSRQEISAAMQCIKENPSYDTASFDQLMRCALTYLSTAKHS